MCVGSFELLAKGNFLVLRVGLCKMVRIVTMLEEVNASAQCAILKAAGPALMRLPLKGPLLASSNAGVCGRSILIAPRSAEPDYIAYNTV